MPDKGYYSRLEVDSWGLPFWTGSRWIGEFSDMCVLLTKSRCKHFGFSIEDGEQPVAFRYTTNGPGTYKYTPVYDRTNRFIDDKLLLHFEFYSTHPLLPEVEKKLILLKSRRYQIQESLNDRYEAEDKKNRLWETLKRLQIEIDEIENIL